MCFLTARYPFFKSDDDFSGLVEYMSLFGTQAFIDLAKLFSIRISELPQFQSNSIEFVCKKLHPEGFDEFPSSAYDLLTQCLKINPYHRITAAEALEHPFLKNSI